MGRALIVSAGANSNEYIAARLSEMGYSRPVIIPSGAEARRRMSESDFELIVVNAPLPDEFGHELCITAVEQTDAGVVFLVKAAQAEQLLAPLNEQGVLLLSKPFTTPLFLQAMHMAAAGNHRLQRLRQENARLQDKIGQLRLVSRAKCCLVEHAHMTEAEAHRYLEKQAMDTRRDRAEVAEEVLEERVVRVPGDGEIRQVRVSPALISAQTAVPAEGNPVNLEVLREAPEIRLLYRDGTAWELEQEHVFQKEGRPDYCANAGEDGLLILNWFLREAPPDLEDLEAVEVNGIRCPVE